LNDYPSVECDPTDENQTYSEFNIAFPSSGYQVTTSTPVAYVVIRAQNAAAGAAEAVFKSVVDSYPVNVLAPASLLYYCGGVDNTTKTNCIDNGDLAIQIWRNESPLTITSPEHNSINTSVSAFEGACPNEDVHYYVCNKTVGGTPIWCEYNATVCYNDIWYSSAYNLTERGYYSLLATTTYQTAYSFFVVDPDYTNATSTIEQLDELFEGISCPIDIFGAEVDFCSLFRNLLLPHQKYISKFRNIPDATHDKLPFAYYFQVKDSLTSTLASTTATSTLPSLSLEWGQDATSSASLLHYDIDVFSEDLIRYWFPQTALDWFRLILSLAEWIAFAFWGYHRVLKIWG